MKLMILTSYQELINTKYGDKTILSGLLYENIYPNIVGRQHYDLWLDYKIIGGRLHKDLIGHDVYVDVDLNGKAKFKEIK